LESLKHCNKWDKNPKPEEIFPRPSLDIDFEDVTLNQYWFDSSTAPHRIRWEVEDLENPFEGDRKAPEPIQGTKYMRAARNADRQSGQVLLLSQPFMASPGDKVTFSYWIRSTWPQTSYLQVK